MFTGRNMGDLSGVMEMFCVDGYECIESSRLISNSKDLFISFYVNYTLKENIESWIKEK